MRLLTEYALQFKRFQRNARLYLISNALSGVTAGILLVLYNLYLVSLGYHTDFVGAVLFAGTIGAGLAIFPAGVCVDRFSGKVVLIGSSALIGVAGVGQILFRQPLPLLISAFVAGVGIAFLLVVNAPFLTINSTPEERPHLFSMNISLGLVTLVLGEVLGGALPVWFRSMPWLMAPLPPWAASLLAGQPDPRSYQLALLFAGVIAAPSFIPLFMLGRGGGRADAGRVFHEGTGGGTADDHKGPPLPTPPPSPLRTDDGVSIKLALSRVNILLRTPFFFLMLIYIFTGLGAGLFIPYFNIYFVQHLKASSSLFGLIDGGANAITALLTLIAPLLAKRLGRINTITLTRLASIPLLLTIGLTGILPLAAFLYLFRQGSMDMSAGILQVYSMEAVSERYRGLANSSYQVSFQVPLAIATPIGGLIITYIGYPPIFLLGAFCYMLAIITLWGRFGRRKTDRTEPSSHPVQETAPVVISSTKKSGT
jgi:MFS family permease